MTRWNAEQVKQFAPDEKSTKAARKLSTIGPWSDAGCTDTLLWGKCQGSGSKPYQVSVDLSGPAAKCTCPSRKFPCKHSIALVLLWSEGGGSIPDCDIAADFAADWSSARVERATKKRKTAKEGPADPAAQAKRLEKRVTVMTQALEEFERWLGDLYRQGAAAAKSQPYTFWDSTASRLVDGQLPSLADRVRAMPSTLASHDWADNFLMETGRWFTAVQAWTRRDALSPAEFGNLRTYLGWAWTQDEIRKAEPLVDSWTVEGVHRSHEGRLKMQRTWLRGETDDKRIVILDFAAGGTSLGVPQLVGARFETPIHPYPGAGVVRGIFGEEPKTLGTDGHLGPSCDHANLAPLLASSISANPFVDVIPVSVSGCLVALDQGFLVVDAEGRSLTVVDTVDPWRLLAVAGPRQVKMFGELEGRQFRPLSLESDGSVVAV